MALDPIASLPSEPEIAVVQSAADLAAALRQGVPHVEVQEHLNVPAASDPLTRSLVLDAIRGGARHIRVRTAPWRSPQTAVLGTRLMPHARSLDCAHDMPVSKLCSPSALSSHVPPGDSLAA